MGCGVEGLRKRKGVPDVVIVVAVIPGICVRAHDDLDGGFKSAVRLVSNVVRRSGGCYMSQSADRFFFIRKGSCRCRSAWYFRCRYSTVSRTSCISRTGMLCPSAYPTRFTKLKILTVVYTSLLLLSSLRWCAIKSGRTMRRRDPTYTHTYRSL